jgi:aspartyl-tRNA(Asn)/glutamyl-tRNA(Gln) amidotransferase subunit C
MKLSIEQVRHVANLARLALSAEEEVRFQGQLSAILEAVDALAALDTTNVPPTSHVNACAPLVRLDEPADMLTSEQALANAPQRVGTSFAIPRVIE